MGETRRWGLGRPQFVLPGRTNWRRELRWPGQVLVAPGDRLEPETEVAAGLAPAPLRIVALGRAQPVVRAGQPVAAGGLLARRKPFLRRAIEVASPVGGTVRAHTDGQLVIAPSALAVRLPAQLPGIVSATHERWGVDVEGDFGLVYGTDGAGPEVHGQLGEDIAVFVDPVTPQMLQAALGQGIRALVAPSLTAPAAPSVACLLTEKEPGRPMAPPIAEALLAHVGSPAAIQFGACPVLGFASNGPPAAQQQQFGLGSWVRLADGRVARLLEVEPAARAFPSGVRAVAANVDLGDGTEAVALDSLEWVA
ncbi:MAG: hypothetical protein KGJ86_15030 [Chloroflexota bacterium]|nr:hypothetical protein [Chloroflexota bacterium]